MKVSAEGNKVAMRSLDSTLAGSWYPATAKLLDASIKKALAGVPDSPNREVPRILVLPHAGYDYSAQTAAYGIKRILGAEFKRVVLLAPSHRAYVENSLVAPEAEAVSTPYGVILVDREAIQTVARGINVSCCDSIHANEHSAQIEYPMLQYALKDFKIVPFIVGTMDAETIIKAAGALRPILDNDTLLVVSSDFTHYGRDFDFEPFDRDVRANVEKMDLGAFECIREKDFRKFMAYIGATGATICGRNPLAVMLALVPPNAEFEKLHYETSSDESYDFSRFVCYMSIAGFVDWGCGTVAKAVLTDEEKIALLRFARSSIRQMLDTGKAYRADFFAKEATGNMRCKMGCFVTLNQKRTHDLRGCIGEIVARRPLYQAVTALAVQSAFYDPRFPELEASEFENITVEISALTPEHPVDSWRDIVIGKHGMTVSKNGRMAVFLPQVAPEQGWTLEETLTYLSRKAGLAGDAWREGASFTVFEAIVFREDDFLEASRKNYAEN